MRSNPFENTGERSNFDRTVVRNDFVILTVALRSYSNVRTGLPGGLITKHTQCLHKAQAVDITRQSH